MLQRTFLASDVNSLVQMHLNIFFFKYNVLFKKMQFKLDCMLFILIKYLVINNRFYVILIYTLKTEMSQEGLNILLTFTPVNFNNQNIMV